MVRNLSLRPFLVCLCIAQKFLYAYIVFVRGLYCSIGGAKNFLYFHGCDMCTGGDYGASERGIFSEKSDVSFETLELLHRLRCLPLYALWRQEFFLQK